MPAVTPAQAFKAPNVEAHVERINRDLTGEWSRYDLANGKCLATKGMSAAVVEHVESVFRAAGWEVTTTDDQRDGQFMRFKPRATIVTSHDC